MYYFIILPLFCDILVLSIIVDMNAIPSTLATVLRVSPVNYEYPRAEAAALYKVGEIVPDGDLELYPYTNFVYSTFKIKIEGR